MKKIAQALCACMLLLLMSMIVPMNPALADVTCYDGIAGTSLDSGECPGVAGCTQCTFSVENPELDEPVCLEYTSSVPNEETVTETWDYYDPLPQEHKLTPNFTTSTRVYHTTCDLDYTQVELFTEFAGNPDIHVERVACPGTATATALSSKEVNRKVTPFSLTASRPTYNLQLDSNLPNKRLTCKNLDNKYETSVSEYNCGFHLDDIRPRKFKSQSDYCTSSAVTAFSMKPFVKGVKCRLIEKNFDLGINSQSFSSSKIGDKTTIVLDKLVAEEPSNSHGSDEVYIEYSIDQKREQRFPEHGNVQMEKGDVWPIGLPITFEDSLVVSVYEYDPIGTDSLGSHTYLPDDPQPDEVELHGHDDSVYILYTEPG